MDSSPKVHALLLAISFTTGCAPEGGSFPSGAWKEFPWPTATLEADGLHVVVNREQFENGASLGGGEGGDRTRRWYEAWFLDGAAATRTSVGRVSMPDPLDYGVPWEGDWRAGHVWSAEATGLFKDGVEVFPLPMKGVNARAFGRSADGGVAFAMLRENFTVAVWSEGEPQPRELPQLSLASSGASSHNGLGIALSSGPRLGVAVAHGGEGIPLPTLVWAEGSSVTEIDGGVPLAFFADQLGTKVVLRSGTERSEALHDGPNVRQIDRSNDNIFSGTCLAVGFDSNGALLTLASHVEGVRLREGLRRLDVPLDGSSDVSWCSVLSDGKLIHVVWLERGDRDASSPTPRMLHHVIVENFAVRSAQKVDVGTYALGVSP